MKKAKGTAAAKNTKNTKVSYYERNKERLKDYQKQRYNALRDKVTIGKELDNIDWKIETKSGNYSAELGSNTFFEFENDIRIVRADSSNIMYFLNGFIYSCCSINASNVAAQNLHLYATVNNDSEKFLHNNRILSKDKIEYIKEESTVKSLSRVRNADNMVEILEHPILDLLNSINSFNNLFETFELTSMYLDMIGDAYWWVKRDKLGIPYEMWVLQGQYVKIIPSKSEFIKGYLYGPNVSESDINGELIDRTMAFKEDEIIHFKTPNPNSIYYGCGAAQKVISAINRMNAMDISEQARLDNMGRPDGIINYKAGKLEYGQMNRYQKLWNNAIGGPNKAGKIIVMDEDFDLKTLGFSPRDMEYLSGRVWSLKEVCSAFNIPYSFMDTSDTKKATSEVSERWYAKNGILPRITRIQEKLNEKLVPMFDTNERMFLLYDNPVPEDRRLKLEENVGYVNAGIITVNEARLNLGLPSLGEEYDKPVSNGKVDTSLLSDDSGKVL